MSTTKQRPRLLTAIWFVVRWPLRILFTTAIFYACFLALGCVPVNRAFQPARGADRVVIYIRSNAIHTDLVLPVRHSLSETDWHNTFPPADFLADVSGCEYVAIGWGNRAFYIDTPTWAEFKISTAAGALFLPSESVLHVEYLPAIQPQEYFRAVSISAEQYQQLLEFVRTSIAIGNEGTASIASERTYHTQDRFYVSTGRYHAFNTCNQWTGRGLRRAGVTTGLWTPLQPQVLHWLPKSTAHVAR